MTERIIAITPADQYFSFTWQLGTRCNYDCMYCDASWHDNHSNMLDLSSMQQIWQNVWNKTSHLNLPYKLSFTGGEVTVNKDFLPFITWLRHNTAWKIFQILATTNGSASVTYYQRMFEVVDNISFSMHSEHINEQDFFSKIIKLHQFIDKQRFLHVNIMNEWWNKDRIKLYADILASNGISYSVNEINYAHQTRTIPIMKGNLNLEISQ